MKHWSALEQIILLLMTIGCIGAITYFTFFVRVFD